MDDSDVEAIVKETGGISANAAAAVSTTSSLPVAATTSATPDVKAKPTQAHKCRRRHRAM